MAIMSVDQDHTSNYWTKLPEVKSLTVVKNQFVNQ